MRRRRASQPVAGGPCMSRRKLAELDPPPVDHISTLPDDLIHEIILLLPVKDAGRTQVLSSRWRRLWGSAPLSLDCCDIVVVPTLASYREDASTVLSPILSAHPGPLRRLCARAVHLYGDKAWLRSTALDTLEELEFAGPMRKLPASMFRFSDTLRVASIADCNLPDDVVQGLHFPRLKQLGLERVSVSERSLHGLVARSPALKFLLLHSSSGFRRLRINSLSLTRLCVHVDPKAHAELDFDEIVLENAPRLERLIYLYSFLGLDVSVYHLPKVETFDFLTNLQSFATKLVSAYRVIQESHVISSTTAVHTVKSLSVDMCLLSLDKVVDLMRLFPCLEKLHVKSHKSDPEHWWRKNLWRRKHRNFIRSHDIRVKILVLEPYLGTSSHVNFATFFILNARKLESMTFQIQAGVYNEGFLARQCRKLQIDNKVSRDARFHFTSTSCKPDVPSTKHLRDFDLIDPFLGGC